MEAKKDTPVDPSRSAQSDEQVITQYVRCYTEPDQTAIERRKQTRHPAWAKRKRARARQDGAAVRQPSRSRDTVKTRPPTPDELAIAAIGAPFSGWHLVFDTETEIDVGQRLRIGVYAIYGIERDLQIHLSRQGRFTREVLDRLHEHGIFYDPTRITEEEIASIEAYAHVHDMHCMTRDGFVADVLYPWLMRKDALVIGHNLPFDLSRLATAWSEGAREYRNGFSLKLCPCPHEHCFDHPRIRIKTIGHLKAFIAFQQVRPPVAKGHRRRAGYCTRGRFLDTATLARALLGPGDMRLEGLSQTLGVAHPKLTTDEHGGPITPDYLDYAVRDVETTWEVYQKLRDLYRQHGVFPQPGDDQKARGTPIWQIYSEASLGKAYLKKLGVPPFLQQHPDLPPKVLGAAMSAYYGGRSEAHIRLDPREVLYTDFKSQYPTVNALMRIQDLLLAEHVGIRDVTDDIRHLLSLTPAELLARLHDPQFWPQLRVFVRLRPNGDVLPVRAEYGPDGLNIGLNIVSSGPPAWYALADVLVSVLLTGKMPDVLEAFELVPEGQRIATTPIVLFSDERFRIDLQEHDLFTKVIDLRGAVRREQKRAKQEGRMQEANYLDSLQLALKLLANSTSYGVLVEITAEEALSEPVPIDIYGLEIQRASVDKIERPGRYFAGPLGALIPAAGRLLLGIAERLAADRGLTYAICDTDSMAFARPVKMDREEFRRCVADICQWFTVLSPYEGQPPLLEYEDVNDWDGQPEALYCLAVSTKRYALYNTLPDGTLRLRKFTAHGLGTWSTRRGYTPPARIPEPCQDVHNLGGERWQYDLWYDFVLALESGHLPNSRPLLRDERGVPRYVPVLDHPWFDEPAFFRVTVSTYEQFKRFRRIADLRPFNFFTALPALLPDDIWRRHARADADGPGWSSADDPYRDLAGTTFYAPYAIRPDELHDVHRHDETDALVDERVQFKTLLESLTDYYQHPEWKSGDPRGKGELPRRRLRVVSQQHIGKESNAVKLLTAEETDGALDGEEAGMDGAQMYGDPVGLADILRQYPIADLIAATGVPRRTLYRLREGDKPQPETYGKVVQGLSHLALH